MNINALSRYFKILENEEKAKFLKAKNSGLLDKKIKRAFDCLKNCELCERKCHIDRTKGKLGFCQLDDKMYISSAFDHWGEEFFFVPSFTIFFWSCNFSCQYCQNWSISQRVERPRVITPDSLAQMINACNCKNINFVGGEPTPQLPFILKTLKYVDKNLPVIWNSNFYMSEKSMSLLASIVDVYLSDFKYGNNKCAERLSKVKNYFDVVSRNHILAFKDSEMVIRHLVLPNHLECCTKPVFDFIAENFGDKVIVNIMDQYRPCYNAYKHKEINRRLEAKEFNSAIKYAEKRGLNYIT